MTKTYFSDNPAVVEQIRNTVKEVLGDKFYIEVSIHLQMGGREDLMIGAATSSHLINGIPYQHPDFVSLCWWNWGDNRDELATQSYHCSGGGKITCKADPDNPKEAHLAKMNIHVGVKIPFRKVSGNESVYKAVRKFFENYLKLLKENKHRLVNTAYVDYETVLG